MAIISMLSRAIISMLLLSNSTCVFSRMKRNTYRVKCTLNRYMYIHTILFLPSYSLHAFLHNNYIL